MIYADVESIVVSENNEKKNPNEPYTKRHQRNTAWTCDYKLVCVDDTFNKPYNKSYMCKDAVYNFINRVNE